MQPLCIVDAQLDLHPLGHRNLLIFVEDEVSNLGNRGSLVIPGVEGYAASDQGLQGLALDLNSAEVPCDSYATGIPEAS
ncbi:hypothetical protein D9M68_659230 [compost metagenome]